MPFTGTTAVWAMKPADYIATNFPGTSAGIQSALDYAGSGGSVTVGAGTVDIVSPGISMYSNQTLRGAGMGATVLRLANTQNVDVVLISGKTDVTMRDLTIDGNKANQSVAKQGIRCTTSTRVTLERIDSHDCEQDGFYISGCTDVKVRGCTSRDNGRNGFSCGDANGRSVRVRFTDCTSSGHSNALAIGFALEPASYSSIRACHSIGDDYGITCLGGASDDSSHNVISGNFILDFGTSATDHVMQGITVAPFTAGASRITVAKNFIRANSAVSAAARPIHGIVVGAVSGVKLIGNDIGGFNAASTSTAISMIDSPTRFIVAKNEIDSPGDYGINIVTGTRGTIANNIIRNCSKRSTGARDGIRLDTSSFDIVITGNNIYDDGTPTCNFAIKSQGSSDRLTINGNQFRGMAAADVISLSGNLNVVGRNQGLPRPTVASAATITLPPYGDMIEISAANAMSAGITASWPGRVVTLVFTSNPVVSNGTNLNLQGTFNTSAKDTLTIACDGTNWFEIARSPNV